MYTEHLQNVRVGYVIAGWLVSIAIASFAMFILVALNLLNPDAFGGGPWVSIAMIIGFVLGGAFVGFRTGEAPILHGIAIGLTSILAWVIINSVITLLFQNQDWVSLDPVMTATAILVQIISAVLGARWGYRLAIRAAEREAGV